MTYKHRFQGDVQMCVTLILVLGDMIKISQERVEQWFFSYIGRYTKPFYSFRMLIVKLILINKFSPRTIA